MTLATVMRNTTITKAETAEGKYTWECISKSVFNPIYRTICQQRDFTIDYLRHVWFNRFGKFYKIQAWKIVESMKWISWKKPWKRSLLWVLCIHTIWAGNKWFQSCLTKYFSAWPWVPNERAHPEQMCGPEFTKFAKPHIGLFAAIKCSFEPSDER